MPNMRSTVLSRRLGATSFIIHRSPGHWEGGRFIQDAPETITARGNVQPPKESEIEQLPEGDRTTGIMCFVTPTEIFMTRKDGVSDELEWSGKRYKVLAVKDWAQHGFYKAFAHLKG